MNKIHFLAPDIVSQIAAGQVIERPAFAVKELLDNSIDAKATQISIQITRGGLESIIVNDNGEGMSPSDMIICWQKNSTSKISTFEDLNNIQSLGFRGEALASLAAVSNLTINSRTENDTYGHQIILSGGKLIDAHPFGMPYGTNVEVNNLFVHTPVREKFVSNPQTEWHHIVQIVQAYALAFPKIRFTLFNNKKQILNLNSTALEERLNAVLGEAQFNSLLRFQTDDPYFKINAFLGKPQLSSNISLPSYIFVNQRVIKNKAVALAIKNAYQSLLKANSYPFFLLYITTSAQTIDINIHPRKEELKFYNEKQLLELLFKETTHVLNTHNLTFQWNKLDGQTKSFAADILRQDLQPALKRLNKTHSILQIHNTYLISQTDKGILFIDQHAAHERVLYEKLCERFTSKILENKIYQLTRPQPLILPLSQSVLLTENIEILQNLGFNIMETFDRHFEVKTVPFLFRDRNIVQLLTDILNDLESTNNDQRIDTQNQRMLSYLACRSAIKAGQPLTKIEIKNLLKQLALTKTSYTCPHGRPTHIEIDLSYLEKMFGRS